MIGLSVGVVALVLLLVALAVVLFIWKRKKSNGRSGKGEEHSDFNPVYATYEVHDDPVAEVKARLLQEGMIDLPISVFFSGQRPEP